MPPPTDVQVAHPEGVQSPKAPAADSEGCDPLALGPSRRRPHRRTRDITAPTRGPQVPPPTNVKVVHSEGVQSPKATAADPEGRDPLAPGPSRRRPYRRTRDIAAPTRGPQVPPLTDVQVAHLEDVQSPKATAADPEGRDPLAPGPSRRRPHRRTRDIAAPTRGL